MITTKAWLGMARRGEAKQARRGLARQGAAWHGEAGRGKAKQARRGLAWHGTAWHGEAGRGKAKQARRGAAGPGTAWRGEAKQARRGAARRGLAGQGMAGNQQSEVIMVQWKWKDGYPSKVDAKVAADSLAEIKQKSGGNLNAQTVVDESRPKNAPLHKAFEWRDGVAAEAYRRQQASQMIRAVVRVDSPGATPTRIYVGVPGEDKTSINRDCVKYVTINEAATDARLYAAAMHRLIAALNSARRSVDELQAAAKIIGLEPERFERIALAVRAIEAASAVVADLH